MAFHTPIAAAAAAVTCSVCLVMAGCAPATPRWDARFGDATRAAFAAQVLHPAAVRDIRPVDGVDGHSAVAAQQRYVKSFSEAPPASAFTIGVSGAK